MDGGNALYYKKLSKIILKNTADMLIILSSDLLVKYINTPVEKILNWKKNDVYQKQINIIFQKYNIENFINTNVSIKKSKKITSIFLNNRKLKISWQIIPFFDNKKKM